jgi:hypothetical protein
VGSDCVVVLPPSFNQNLGFAKCVDNYAIEQFVSEPGIEAFPISVFPRRSCGDERGFRTDGPNPSPHIFGDNLGVIVHCPAVHVFMHEKKTL